MKKTAGFLAILFFICLPQAFAEVQRQARSADALSSEQKTKIDADHRASYDAQYGGWGTAHKFIDTDNLEYAIGRAENGDAAEESMARRALDAALDLLDPEWGGFYQYSDSKDWKSPHYEKLVGNQADCARLYALAYSAFVEPRYYEAARATLDYVLKYLTGPEGAFYAGQAADVDDQFNGYSFYSLKDDERVHLGRMPEVDKHFYTRENGWMIRALASFYDATGEEKYLAKALVAAQWTLAERLLEPSTDRSGAGKGGFKHDSTDAAGSALGDTLSMGLAFLALYESTSDRQWLIHAQNSADFIQRSFRKDNDPGTGFLSNVSENIQIARLTNKLFHMTGRANYRTMAEVAMRFLSSNAVVSSQGSLTGILSADSELGSDPLHLTVVGKKDDPKAKMLYQAALGYPTLYRRVEWWDRREGALPHSDVDYPALEEAASFICAKRACSQPFFSPEKIAPAIDRLKKA